MSDEPLPEPDRVPGAPHPREALRVVGQDTAVADFVSAARAHRLHHGWLISGPRGTGKATLAWSIAKWLLGGGTSDDLTTDPDVPAIRRIRALSEPRLHLVRRPVDEKTQRLRSEITVDEIRKLGIDIPVMPGIMPIVSFSKLARFSDVCGAELPRWMRRKFEGLGDDTDAIRAFGLDVVTSLCERLLAGGAPGLHFYSMNQSALTLEICKRLGI